MPLPRSVPFISQENDPTGCWYACARMLRLYFMGGYAMPLRLPELENADGTHKRLEGDQYNQFMKNESLSFLPFAVPTNSATDYDAVLTNYGPIMVTWSGGLHVSIVVGAAYTYVYYHDPALGPNQKLTAAEFNIRRMGGGGFAPGLLVRNPNVGYSIPIQTELVSASDGVTKKDGWPTGWWRVSDGGSPWYYYLGNDNIAMSSRTAPSSLGPPAKPHNTGTWVFKDPNTLVITWKQVAGAPKPCEETFWNASRECVRMNANSNLYAPLVATRNKQA
jgi:hypothetical protein